MEAIWADDSKSAVLLSARGDYEGRIHLGHWYEPDSRTPHVAWMVDYLADDEMRSVFVALADSLPNAQEQRRLEAAARSAMEKGPTEVEEPALPPSEFGDELDLLLMAWGDASERLRLAASRPDEHARAHIYVALTEVLSWTCTFDQVVAATWKGFDAGYRERVSKEVDAAVAASISRSKAQADDLGVRYVEGPAAIFDTYRERQRTGEPYKYWSQALAIKQHDLDPRFLSGLHWIRGKFFHRGVLHAVNLRQWRPGAEPRWKWLPSVETGQGAHGTDRRKLADYDAVVAGKDVIGSLGLGGILLDAVWLFTRLYYEQAGT